ncbi:histone-lysine N-methyltransferase 2A [Striga asiatica]|uniref:Histone-lysine N-methyltransferase 2A n=1 Tax=Striga asiatica TaxID=4170 RepID=A0A5A7PV90_STRAF|nr:histone-lysine N-methyltransferase 2A [Striga asiatica]
MPLLRRASTEKKIGDGVGRRCRGSFFLDGEFVASNGRRQSFARVANEARNWRRTTEGRNPNYFLLKTLIVIVHRRPLFYGEAGLRTHRAVFGYVTVGILFSAPLESGGCFGRLQVLPLCQWPRLWRGLFSSSFFSSAFGSSSFSSSWTVASGGGAENSRSKFGGFSLLRSFVLLLILFRIFLRRFLRPHP